MILIDFNVNKFHEKIFSLSENEDLVENLKYLSI